MKARVQSGQVPAPPPPAPFASGIHSEVRHWSPTSVQQHGADLQDPQAAGPNCWVSPRLKQPPPREESRNASCAGKGGWDYYFCFSESLEKESVFAKDEGVGQISRGEAKCLGRQRGARKSSERVKVEIVLLSRQVSLHACDSSGG